MVMSSVSTNESNRRTIRTDPLLSEGEDGMTINLSVTKNTVTVKVDFETQ